MIENKNRDRNNNNNNNNNSSNRNILNINNNSSIDNQNLIILQNKYLFCFQYFNKKIIQYKIDSSDNYIFLSQESVSNILVRYLYLIYM